MARKVEPAHILPFQLRSIEDFLQQSHPRYDPDEDMYDEYWTSFVEKSILGLWGHDYDKKKSVGGFRYMPGNLFFHINGTIMKMEEPGKPEVIGPPRLRDVEWFIGYNLNVCDGFTGFTGDNEYTGFFPVHKIEAGIPLSETDKVLMDMYGEYIHNKYGRLKKFRHPRDILYDTYKDPVGEALYLNQKHNLILLTTRGTGKTFGITGMEVTYKFVFNGARTLEDYFQQRVSNTVVVGSFDSKKSDDMLSKFSANWTYIKNSLGSYSYGGEEHVNGALFFPTSGSLELSKVFSKTIRAKNNQGDEGIPTQIAHVSWFNNASAAVGHRGDIVCEEAGLLRNFNRVHGENEAVQKRDTKVFKTTYLGTGGDVQAIRQIQTAYHNPDKFGCLGFPDVFSHGSRDIGAFIPSYYAQNIFKSELGNTEIQKAFDEQMYQRNQLKGTDRYATYCISYPIIPREMFRSSESAFFPVDKAEEALAKLEEEDARKSFSVGNLEYSNGPRDRVMWREDLSGALKPILRLGDEDRLDSKVGAFVIFEHPVANLPERTTENPLYLTIYDQVHRDDSGTSLVYAGTFKFWDFANPRKLQMSLVAEWCGRDKTLDKNHERVFKMAAYYNSMILFDDSITDFKRYATQTNRYHWLQPRPGVVLDGILKDGRKYDVGVQVVPGMGRYLIQYLAELLTTVVRVEERLEGSVLEATSLTVVDGLRSYRALEEIIAYNEDDNFDCVSALMLLALWVKDQILKPVNYGQDTSTERAEKEFAEALRNVEKINYAKRHSAFDL